VPGSPQSSHAASFIPHHKPEVGDIVTHFTHGDEGAGNVLKVRQLTKGRAEAQTFVHVTLQTQDGFYLFIYDTGV
jgi:hypothetical protein